jgi:hypothetical protein
MGKVQRLDMLRLFGRGRFDGRWRGSLQFDQSFERCDLGFEGEKWYSVQRHAALATG